MAGKGVEGDLGRCADSYPGDVLLEDRRLDPESREIGDLEELIPRSQHLALDDMLLEDVSGVGGPECERAPHLARPLKLGDLVVRNLPELEPPARRHD